MAKDSKIQWTDATWNVARGCSKVDEDCKYCYMYRDSMNGTRYEPKEVIKTKTVFDLPLRIKEPSKIFTSSLTDFFHEDIDIYRDEAWDIIRNCRQHTFQILTKRPERIEEYLPSDWGEGWNNVWLGTSVGSENGRQRIYDILKVRTKTRFISFEPLWSRVDMNLDISDLIRLDWAIIGGESGNENGKYKYRPCEIAWIEELIADLTPTTAIFVKQLGTHLAKKLKLTDRHGGDIDEWPGSFKNKKLPKTMDCINGDGRPVENRDTGLCATCGKLDRKLSKIKLPDDPKPIKKQSDEMSRMMAIYARVAAKFLKRNPRCAVIPTLPAVEVHHRAGRSITAYYDEWAEQRGICLLLDERLYLPVSREGHIEIERRPEWARKMGFTEDRLILAKVRSENQEL